MEEQRLLKKKRKHLNGSNRRHFAEACTELGDFYNRRALYEDAFREYEQSANVYRDVVDAKLHYGLANRMMGEMCMLLAEFDRALRYENVYLSVAKELENKIEEQRAFATLGRIYLLQGQSLDDVKTSALSLNSALKNFMKSLTLCESLKGKINNQELMDMRARLLLNIGVVSEHLGDLEKAIEYLHKAVSICKNNDLYELLTQCYITEGLLYTSKHSNHSKAISCFNFAFQIAARLDNKISKQCEIILLKAEALCKISDFQSAKIILLKAWKMNTPNDSEKAEIEKMLRTVAALCYTEDSILTTNSNDYETLKLLYEKMGDGACSIKNYEKAIFYYSNMLENAEKIGNSDRELISIYISLYQTYKDLKNYKMAISFMKKEYEIIKKNPDEAIPLLLSIAEVHVCNQQVTEAIDILMDVKRQAIMISNRKYELKSLKLLCKLYEEQSMCDEVQSIKKDIQIISAEINSETSSEEEDDENSTPNIGDDICLEDLTDLSDNEDKELTKSHSIRKRGKSFMIKKNSKGETQLHQASISGNSLLVTRLVSQGHPVNIRDNAGWLPIHEACIHGHKAVVEILLKNGAHVNDKGGTQCDGITPLYDAASNGHLEIIELLLENGASPQIKTDYGETAFEILKKWYKNENVSTQDKILYESICKKLSKSIDRIEIIKANTDFSDAKFPKSQTINNAESSNIALRKKSLRRNLIESDDSLDSVGKENINTESNSDSSSNSCKKHKVSEYNSDSDGEIKRLSSVNEYKNAISALRNRPCNNKSFKSKDEDKSRQSALLDPDEVGDDWLDDDVQHRKRKHSSDHLGIVKRKSKDNILDCGNDVLEKISNKNNSSSQKNNSSANRDDGLNSYHSDSSNDDFKISTPGNQTPFKDKVADANSSKPRRKWKHQISLMKVGFERNKISKTEIATKKHTNNLASNNQLKINIYNDSEEPDSTTESPISPVFDHWQKSDRSSKKITPYTSTAPVAVKVKIKDRLFLIPISTEKLQSQTVGWLSIEASKRYYSLEGVQPSLQLITTDGAILANDDPLNIVLSSNELVGSITNWNLPPLGERYVECSAQLKYDVDDHIKTHLEASQATHILQLCDLNLSLDDAKPIFKALNHQTCLQSLILSNNCIGNDGLKCLVQCLPSLTNISYLNLSNNCIDFDGTRHMLNLVENTKHPVCPLLQSLDISFNPIGDLGFHHILQFSKKITLKAINLRACDIICEQILTGSDITLIHIEDLDLSHNCIKKSSVLELYKYISFDKCNSIKLERFPLNGLCNQIFEWQYSNLTKIDLSRCNLSDEDIRVSLRLWSKCVNLQEIVMTYNTELKFDSLKNLLQCKNIRYIDLEGCIDILKNWQAHNLQDPLFVDSDRKLEWLKITVNDNSDLKKIIDVLSMQWQNYWSHKSVIQNNNFGEIVFKKHD